MKFVDIMGVFIMSFYYSFCVKVIKHSFPLVWYFCKGNFIHFFRLKTKTLVSFVLNVNLIYFVMFWFFHYLSFSVYVILNLFIKQALCTALTALRTHYSLVFHKPWRVFIVFVFG